MSIGSATEITITTIKCPTTLLEPTKKYIPLVVREHQNSSRLLPLSQILLLDLEKQAEKQILDRKIHNMLDFDYIFLQRIRF